MDSLIDVQLNDDCSMVKSFHHMNLYKPKYHHEILELTKKLAILK